MDDLNSSVPKATDWTSILSDPDLVRNVGKLLQAYREAPPEGREEALLAAMREIKAAAAVEGKASASAPATVEEQSSRPASGQPKLRETASLDASLGGEEEIIVRTPALPFTGPPFEPDIFTPNSAGDRRHHPRVRCSVAVELRVNNADKPIWGNLSNTSVGGCQVETAEPVPSGSNVEIGLWVASGKIWVKGFALTGVVTKGTSATRLRLRFDAMGAGDRDNLRQFLKYVQEGVRAKRSESSYMALLK